MTRKYTYTENKELWAAENRAKAAGWEKTSDCYWCQIFRKGEDEVITSREDEGTPVNIAEAFTAEQEQEAPAEAQEPAEAMERISQIRAAVTASTGRSAWSRGVNDYAMELLEELEEAVRGGWQDMGVFSNKTILRKALLNGADSWSQYSWGGSSLIYNGDIAERLCCPSELKKTRNGERRPNAREEWLDTQARALGQACYRIVEANRRIAYMEDAVNE